MFCDFRRGALLTSTFEHACCLPCLADPNQRERGDVCARWVWEGGAGLVDLIRFFGFLVLPGLVDLIRFAVFAKNRTSGRHRLSPPGFV